MNAGPRTIAGFVAPYLDELRAKGLAATTIRKRAQMLRRFVTYCNDRALDRPADLTVAFCERYARHLSTAVSAATGKRLAIVSQIDRLTTLRDFCRFLASRGVLLFNPALSVDMPKQGRVLPRGVLEAAEVERMMLVPDITDPLGLRNRAMLEVLYSTGMRRGELCALTVPDVDFPGGTIFIREGKGRVDRVVPVGRRALSWVRRYLEDVRPALAGSDSNTDGLFLSIRGGPLSGVMVTQIMTAIRRAAGIKKKGAVHILRHTAATLMLENGADVRFVQQLLGHADLGTTQRYTHVAIHALRAAHARSHPVNFSESNPELESEDES